MQKGKVKKVISDRGFGFISSDDGKEIFLHQSSVLGASFDSIREGQEVEFDVEKSPKGPRAINVSLIA
jgi:cold shock protein